MTDRSHADARGRRWLRLYPRAWRDRYEDELVAVLGSDAFTVRTRFDLLRGALDAHVHPLASPSPPIAPALIAGVAWVGAGLFSSLQPLMPDWPGFMLETLPVGTIGALAALRAAVQTGRRSGLDAPRGTAPAIMVAITGYTLWVAALLMASLGGPYGAITGAAGAMAAVGTVSVGFARRRAGDRPAAEVLLVAGAAMLIPSPVAWILAGSAWIALAVASVRPVMPLRPA